MFLIRSFKATEIVIAKSGEDIAMIKVDGVLDTNVYTPICLPDKGSINMFPSVNS